MSRRRAAVLVLVLSALLAWGGVAAAQTAPADAGGSEEALEAEAERSLPGVSPLTEEDRERLDDFRRRLEEGLGEGAPKREYQLVYSLTPWNGREYGSTIAAGFAPTMYLLADYLHIVNVNYTDVYFWPITGEYMGDWTNTRDPVEGRLVIFTPEGREVQRLERTDYLWRWLGGGKRELLVGEEAHEAERQFQESWDAYRKAYDVYMRERDEWQRIMDGLIRRLHETGVPASEDEIPPIPQPPEAPPFNVGSIVQGFMVRLPEGRYIVQMEGPDGLPVPHSSKELVVFSHDREGVGFIIRPEDRWTRPIPVDRTSDPKQSIYLRGERTFYLDEPSISRRMNAYMFIKMNQLESPLRGEGQRFVHLWAPGDPLPADAKVQILRNGEVVEEIERKPYYVRQVGTSLGYSIIEWHPDDPLIGRSGPHFEAFRIRHGATDGHYTLRFVDGEGNPYSGGERALRTVRLEAAWSLYVVPLLPAALGLIVFAFRRRAMPKSQSVSA